MSEIRPLPSNSGCSHRTGRALRCGGSARCKKRGESKCSEHTEEEERGLPRRDPSSQHFFLPVRHCAKHWA